MKDTDLLLALLREMKESTNNRLESIDENLAEHMRRCDLLEEMHDKNVEEIEKLKEPRKALIFGKSMLIYVAAVSGSIITIIKLIELLRQ